jgi:thiamine-monophosphate kinase
MLVSGTHFFPDADPYLLGHKTLAVNLSDLAAMGAIPRWATLAISLPQADDHWLERFAAGFFALADQHGLELVGGDTTRGPLNLCVTIFGEVEATQALRRSGAKVGDEIWLSGCLGDAALALAHLQGRVALTEAEYACCAARLHQPQPRVALGRALRGIANSAIDISDGLSGDLGHILAASAVGAEIEFDRLPISDSLRHYPELISSCALSGGDDYELCFTAPAGHHDAVQGLGDRLRCIGRIVAGAGLVVLDATGNPINFKGAGYDHFR